MHASVVIPTYNAGAMLPPLMERLRAQRTPWPFEILVIDSSSSDGTAEYLRAQPDITLIEIDKKEFQHGRTRNLGAERSKGEFIAFLTQDALPVDEFWLYDLVIALERAPNAAGAFGRHEPWPSASPFIKRNIANTFNLYDRLPLVLSKDFDGAQHGIKNETLRRVLHFYSDNNSCMRRSVWQRIPYPEIDFGEDQVWAQQIIRSGYEKIYAMRAGVFHSHDYDYDETFERSKTDAAFWIKHFGYQIVTHPFEKAVELANAADRKWANENGVPEELIQQRMLLNEARIKGCLAAQAEASGD